jgi:hypothetical protein
MPSLVRSGPWPQWGAAFRESPHLWAVAPAALAGWGVLAGTAASAPGHHSGFGGAIVHALAMAAAMALPATNAPLRHVLRSSFADRAVRHCALFLLPFAAAWSAFALAASLALPVAAGAGSPAAAAALILAAAWLAAPARRGVLGRCHGTVPIYAEGPAGLRSSAGYGLRIGGACVAACGPLMLAAMLTPWPLPAMAAAAMLAARERYGRPGAAAAHARLIAASALLLLLVDFGIGPG